MMIECRDLQILLILSETHNITETANRLHITQSALSHQIKKLERYYDVTLFQRKTRPLRFTPAGQELLNLAREMLPKVQQAEQRLKEYAQGKLGRLYLAVECHNCFEWLLPSLDLYRQQYPHIDVDLSLSVSFEAFQALQNGDIDMVITSDPRKLAGISYQALFDYQLGLVMANQHRLATKVYIEPEDLTDENLLIYPVSRSRLDIFKYFMQPAQVEPAQVRTVELTQMMLHLIAGGKGVAALPHWIIAEQVQQGSLTVRPLGEMGLHRTLYAALADNLLELDYIQGFLQIAQQLE
ncbi:LysR family transcriptional regulator [Candidatus Albibeggiatoa sp. nov. NOAA]|uniref:LysR family transcriptional regulator n=1 Tax=Candidatus Albibeggiatoa sp. nov. NOAA TaxID=3162724 RepID=UPI003301016C|nr:LysR family transcriptional regulator [Thiotrichaceae bacterium]